MHYRLHFEQWIRVPLERTFAFFADPNNLPRITPPELSLQVKRLKIAPPDSAHPTYAAVGSEVAISFRIPIIGARMQHLAHITGFEMNRSFRDQHSHRPLMDWDHRHGFEEATRNGLIGTMVVDDLHYALGPGFLGALANSLLVRRQLTQMFEFRRQSLDRLVAAGAL